MSAPTGQPLILASASPRRAQLLRAIGVRFEVIASAAREEHDESRPLTELCMLNARLKALDVAGGHPGRLVVGADTLVGLDGKLFAKPSDIEDARRMLRALSGRVHEVVTGVCLARDSRVETFGERTEVTFRTLTPKIIDEYISLVPVLDKAGAYGIQEHGEMLIEKISGSFDNVMGFPTELFRKKLEEWNTIA